jgi:hypothetical protein
MPNWCRYRIFLFQGDVVGLSLATCYEASKSYAPTCNLITTIESSMWWFLDGITLLSKILNQIAFLVDFSSLQPPNENRQLRLMKPYHWGRLLVHYPKPFQKSSCLKPCRVIASSKPFEGCLSIWHIFANLEQEWRYPLQPWRYCDSRIAKDRFQWPLLGRYLLEVYLALHPLDSPCAYHAPLAIM